MNRPFYTTFAWAYDLLIQGPVKERVHLIVTQLRQRGVTNGAWLLDAGCGTGSYAVALATEGFRVTGVDASSELIAEAKRKGTTAGAAVDFRVGDILRLPEELTLDAVLCRGVLNDLTRQEDRRTVFSSFAGVVRQGGVLVLDVREWQATAARKLENPAYQKTVKTEKGSLTFRSVTGLQPETHSLLIAETHVLQSPDGPESASFDFEMKCWTQSELARSLDSAGFDTIEYFGDYDSAKPAGTTDRLIAVARLA